MVIYDLTMTILGIRDGVNEAIEQLRGKHTICDRYARHVIPPPDTQGHHDAQYLVLKGGDKPVRELLHSIPHLQIARHPSA